MKICVLTHTIPRFSGDPSAPFMDVLMTALVQAGNKVTVVTPFDKQIDRKYPRNYKLKTYKYMFPDNLHNLGYSRTLKGDKSMSIFSYLMSPLLYFFGFLKLLEVVKKEKPEVICAHWIIPNGFIAALVSKITKVPFTVTIPGSDVYLAGKNFIFKSMTGFAAKNASYVISDSSHYLRQLNDLGIYPNKTEVIRYGVNTEKFKPTKKDAELLNKLNIKENQPTVLAVGRMVAKKGFIYLINAMPKVAKKIPNVKLVMVGDGDIKETLEKTVKKNGTAGNTMFAGTISYNELSKYYNLADVFVMPSIKDEQGNIDASPVSMMESMACGARVVSTKFSGGDDLVVKGETGYLVKEKNSGEIAESIINLLSKKLNNKIKDTVREVAVKNFSSKSVAKKYTKLFKSISL